MNVGEQISWLHGNLGSVYILPYMLWHAKHCLSLIKLIILSKVKQYN